MAYDVISGSEFPIEIKVDTTWTAIAGIKSHSLSPSVKDVDTTTFETAGWTRSTVVSRGLEVKLSGFAWYNPTDGSKDPGQAAVEALGVELGTAAEGDFRITLPGVNKALEFSAAVADVQQFSGDTEDVSKWEATLKVQAAPAVVTVTP